MTKKVKSRNKITGIPDDTYGEGTTLLSVFVFFFAVTKFILFFFVINLGLVYRSHIGFYCWGLSILSLSFQCSLILLIAHVLSFSYTRCASPTGCFLLFCSVAISAHTISPFYVLCVHLFKSFSFWSSFCMAAFFIRKYVLLERLNYICCLRSGIMGAIKTYIQ